MSLSSKESFLAKSIDQLLPQTQCEQCGYSGCQPYADAISTGKAQINQCPPGGEVTIHQLAKLLECDVIPLNTEHGEHKPFHLAVIDESECIGCTKCIPVCPVDAILGAAKQLHTVMNQYCTGCELCIPPCPVNCIEMVPDENELSNQNADTERAEKSRVRYALHLKRAEQELSERKNKQAEKRSQVLKKENIQQEVLAAIQRTKDKRRLKKI